MHTPELFGLLTPMLLTLIVSASMFFLVRHPWRWIVVLPGVLGIVATVLVLPLINPPQVDEPQRGGLLIMMFGMLLFPLSLCFAIVGGFWFPCRRRLSSKD